MMITAAVYPQTMHLQQTVPHFVNFDCSKKKKKSQKPNSKDSFLFLIVLLNFRLFDIYTRFFQKKVIEQDQSTTGITSK